MHAATYVQQMNEIFDVNAKYVLTSPGRQPLTPAWTAAGPTSQLVPEVCCGGLGATSPVEALARVFDGLDEAVESDIRPLSLLDRNVLLSTVGDFGWQAVHIHVYLCCFRRLLKWLDCCLGRQDAQEDAIMQPRTLLTFKPYCTRSILTEPQKNTCRVAL